MGVVCFDLIPEALKISEFGTVLIGIVFGTFIMVICDIVVQNKIEKKKSSYKKNSLLKTGIAVRNWTRTA